MEAPVGTPLADAIENVQSWLSMRQMKPLRFASEVTAQTIFLEIEFDTGDEAGLFERDFG
jgi:hypothetical protein